MPVTEARRAFLALEWREAKAEDRAVLAAHLLAPEAIEETLLATAADAQTEATRRQTMRGILRHRYELVVPLNSETEWLDLGHVVSLQHNRFGLSTAQLFRIIGIEPDAANRRLTLQIWGSADPVSLMRLPVPTMAGTGTIT